MASRLVRTAGVSKTLKAVQRKSPELFVKKISWITGAKELADCFSQFGKVTNVTLPFDLQTGLHKGFAFISFEDSGFYEKVKRSGMRAVVDDEEVVCSLVGGERAMLLSDANSTPLGIRENKNIFGNDDSETKSYVEVLAQGSTEGQNVEDKDVLKESSKEKVSLKNTIMQECQKRTKSQEVKLTQWSPKIDTFGRKSWSSRQGRSGTLTKPTVTRLTDSLNRSKEGASEKGYTVAYPPKGQRATSVRNSFRSTNMFNSGNFKASAGAFTKRQNQERMDSAK